MSAPTEAVSPMLALAKREANRMIRDGFDPPVDAEPIAFLCECANASCYQAVWLAAAAYDRARADPAWHLLAAGHDAPADEPLERTP